MKSTKVIKPIFNVAVILLLCFISSCNKEDDSNDNNNNNNNNNNNASCMDSVQNGDETGIDCGGSCMPCIPNEIALIYPVNDSVINPCCTNFQWETVLDGDYHLTISTSETFSNPLIDSIINFKEFLYSINLEPAIKYYWRVKQGDTEKTSSFLIKDIINHFQGNCIVEINKYYWGGAQGVDTTFIDTITIAKNGQRIEVNYPDDNLYRLFNFNNHTIPYTVFYLYGSGSNACTLYLDYTNDSVFVNYKTGSLGGGIVWNMKGEK